MDPKFIFPTLNACLNFFAGIFLLLGWQAIKSKNKERHMRLMVSALVCSALFLCSYLTYHALYGSKAYEGQGVLRGVYFTILLTHTPLAALIVPFAVWAVYYAIKKDYKRHTRITKILFPAWMYVSVTGILIYLMLYVLS